MASINFDNIWGFNDIDTDVYQVSVGSSVNWEQEFLNVVDSHRDKIIYITQIQNRLFTKESGAYKTANNTQAFATVVYIPIQEIEDVTGYSVDLQVVSGGQYSYIAIEPAYYDGTTLDNYTQVNLTSASQWVAKSASISNKKVNYLMVSIAQGEVFFKDLVFQGTLPAPTYTSNGGGATHIAKRTGQLKDLSSYTSDILIVSGGGGGGLLVGETEYTGKEAGGISGSGDNSADQSTGNAFGLGESGTNLSGGGSGLYGGYKGTSSKSGGAGSGYIGNSLLSNKKMVGYNVPTSSAEGTKTESVSVFDSNYVADKPKAGNGHVRIKFLRACWGGEEVPILWAGIK